MNQIELISIPVSDQQRAKAFYEKLGLKLLNESSLGKQQWIQFGFPKGGPSIALVNWFPKMQAGSIQGLVIRTENIVEEIDLLKAKGIAVGGIEETPWGKFAQFSDPDGNGWSLQQV